MAFRSLIYQESLLKCSVCAVLGEIINGFSLAKSFSGMRRQTGNSGAVSGLPLALFWIVTYKYLVAKISGYGGEEERQKANHPPLPLSPMPLIYKPIVLKLCCPNTAPAVLHFRTLAIIDSCIHQTFCYKGGHISCSPSESGHGRALKCHVACDVSCCE